VKIDQVGFLSEGLKAVGAALRDVIGDRLVQLQGEPLAEGGRSCAQVHSHVEHAPVSTADQLVLRCRRQLVVQSADRPSADRDRVIDLDEAGCQTCLGKDALAILALEAPASVADHVETDFMHAGYLGRQDLHHSRRAIERGAIVGELIFGK
jgi:hypothetical protein